MIAGFEVRTLDSYFTETSWYSFRWILLSAIEDASWFIWNVILKKHSIPLTSISIVGADSETKMFRTVQASTWTRKRRFNLPRAIEFGHFYGVIEVQYRNRWPAFQCSIRQQRTMVELIWLFVSIKSNINPIMNGMNEWKSVKIGTMSDIVGTCCCYRSLIKSR